MKPFAAACLALAVSASAMADVPVIRSVSDLPATAFVLDGPASASFMAPSFVEQTVPALRAEAERLLGSGFRIDDPIVRQRLRAGLAAIAVLQHRPADAERLVAEQRADEAKPQLRAVGILMTEAAAVASTGGCAAAAARVTERLDAVDALVVREEAIRRYGRVQTASLGYYAGTAGEMIDPKQKLQGSIGVMDGMLLAIWRMETDAVPPCRDALAAAYRAWIDAPAHQPVDIWPAREPAPQALAAARPVAVAVWESGFDPTLFPNQLAVEVPGPAYDVHLRPTKAQLPPLSDFLAPRFGLQLAVDKGEIDLNDGRDTAEARFFAQRARDASTAEQTDDVFGSAELHAHTHGTWVASTLADGAPFVRLYNAVALPFGADPKPVPILEDDMARWAALMPALGARLRAAKVRIVNMSWGLTASEITEQLLLTGTETDPERARQRGVAMQASVRPAMERLIRSCPGILFVAAAGNSNQSDDILDALPATIDAPNLLVVGATGASGRPTAFTTFGKRVQLYARGEGVAVRAAGGMRMHAAGTSFAAPLVGRAAASMLAVAPSLTPTQVIDGLIASGTAGDGGLRLLHPAQAVAWATARAGK